MNRKCVIVSNICLTLQPFRGQKVVKYSLSDDLISLGADERVAAFFSGEIGSIYTVNEPGKSFLINGPIQILAVWFGQGIVFDTVTLKR